MDLSTVLRGSEIDRAREDTRAAVLAMRNEAEQVLRSVLRPGEPCALLDYPNHGNVGDSAIWLGTRMLLRCVGARVAYACDFLTLDVPRLRRLVGDGPILLQGGGSLGDIWPHFQRFREHVIEAFPDARIVILPQGIHFDEQDNLARARRVFKAHARLTLLVRDRESLQIARSGLHDGAVLCPDMAFGLGPMLRAAVPDQDTVLVARHDKEAWGERAAHYVAADRAADWGDDDPVTGALRAVIRRALRPRLLGDHWRHVVRVYDALARARLTAGVRLLSRGRTVVTDRLHGHLLCVLLGIPHVVLDNRYRKIRNTLETWTGDLPLVSRADSVVEAERLASALLSRWEHGPPSDGTGQP